MKPAKSFTTRIGELSDRVTELQSEVEQWKTAAEQAQGLNHELETRLDAVCSESKSVALQNEHMMKNCQQLTEAAKFYHGQASQALRVVEEVSDAFHSAKASIAGLVSA